MDKLIQPIRRFCHLHGVDFSCFVDDSINISLTKIKALACLKFIKYVFTCAGWELSLAKTKGPATMILYLGFHINSIDMKIAVPHLKVIILANDISKLIDKFHVAGQIHSKELAHVLGMACHFITSHGNIMRICTRTCQQQLGLTVQLHDWNSHLKLTDKMTWELSHLKDFIVRYCFFHIFSRRKNEPFLIYIRITFFQLLMDFLLFLDSTARLYARCTPLFVSFYQRSRRFILDWSAPATSPGWPLSWSVTHPKRRPTYMRPINYGSSRITPSSWMSSNKAAPTGSYLPCIRFSYTIISF